MLRYIPNTVPQYRLEDNPRTAGFSDPFLYSLAFFGSPLARVVTEQQTIEINGFEHPFSPGKEPLPAPGTAVLVVGRFGGSDAGYYYIETSVYEAHQQQRAREQAEHQQRIEQARQDAANARLEEQRQRHLAGQALLARLKLPVRWHVGYKSVVNQLTEKSNGSGRVKNHVQHVVIEDFLSSGRLTRNPGEFLCSQSQSKWGGRYTDEREPGYLFEGETFPPLVDCPACLKLIERHGWLQESTTT